MRLTKDEAICLALIFSNNKNINSPTKLNKILARLNLFMIPLDIEFSLNKYGSFNSELQGLESNEFFSIRLYKIENRQIPSYFLNPRGEKLIADVIKQKLSKIFKAEELSKVATEINRLSSLSATELSEDEHCKLLVDIDDRHKLIHRINTTAVELFDLNEQIRGLEIIKVVDITLSALIEYCYYLARYLKEIRFKNIDNGPYDFEANMMSYYFLCNLEEIIPKLKEQINSTVKDEIFINRCYQYFVNCAKDTYEFSLENPVLHKLIIN